MLDLLEYCLIHQPENASAIYPLGTDYLSTQYRLLAFIKWYCQQDHLLTLYRELSWYQFLHIKYLYKAD